MSPVEPAVLHRHHLVWVDAHRWPQYNLNPLSTTTQDAAAWFSAGRPAVVRRLQADEPREGVGLGIPLPPRAGKRRLALRVALPAIVQIAPPPRLAEVLVAAPAAWQPALASLERQAHALGIVLRVYGSLAWQFLTGETYITTTSDVDLLWELNEGGSWRAFVQLLPAWEHTSGLRADGECIGRDGRAVGWRELIQHTRQVLVKRRDGVELLPKRIALDQVFR